MLVTTLGDLLLDVIVRLAQPLAPGDDATATTRLGAGGQAANVAAWAAELGAQARFVGKRADDDAGRLAADDLARRGVEVLGPVARGRGGVVVSLVEPDGSRTMASDRGVSPELRPDELDPAWFDGCDWLHVAGYSLVESPNAAAACTAAEAARGSGARVSVDLSSWSRIRDVGQGLFRERLDRLEPDLVFANEREWEALAGGEGLEVVLKRGPDGIVADGRELPALPAAVVDSTGAGDALAAGYLVGGAQLGLQAAARCVAQLGSDAVIDIREEVAQALGTSGPVVALETTLIAHGFPPGEGIAVGLESERCVREAGAVPATIGVLDGRVVVGLTAVELQQFGADARKAGPRDLAVCAVQGAVGATTVGGTLAVCRRAGIRFLATGGLGGVHRSFPFPPDVSADLGELARTPALVVSSGVKSLLDVPATAEALETLGVPVLGFRTAELPLFYAARGGPPTSARVETAAEAAAVARAHWELGGGGLLLARPPDESLDDVEPLIAEALEQAAAEGISGGAVTPFVLAFLHEHSGGRTLAANRDLVVANAALAGRAASA